MDAVGLAEAAHLAEAVHLVEEEAAHLAGHPGEVGQEAEYLAEESLLALDQGNKSSRTKRGCSTRRRRRSPMLRTTGPPTAALGDQMLGITSSPDAPLQSRG